MTATDTGKWRLKGYDTFEGGSDAFYDLSGQFDGQSEAEQGAKDYLAELERTQPSENSGGQGENGIQDHVYVVRPDGTQYRFVGS